MGFDIRDFLYITGIGLLGYGLWLKEPWISFSVCGALLAVSGYLMRDKR